MTTPKQDDVCLVIDMDGFHVGDRFQCRELGYCSWKGDTGRVAFKPSTPFKHLTDKEKRYVTYVQRNIHGLRYTPNAVDEEIHNNPYSTLRRLYKEFTTEHRTRVAFKGGYVEKDVLMDLHLPYVDLELLGCPTYDTLRMWDHAELWPSCPWHINPSFHHCAMAECQAFFYWYNNYHMNAE